MDGRGLKLTGHHIRLLTLTSGIGLVLFGAVDAASGVIAGGQSEVTIWVSPESQSQGTYIGIGLVPNGGNLNLWGLERSLSFQRSTKDVLGQVA